MTRTVHKFLLNLALSSYRMQRVDIPKGARFLHCAPQGDAIALWYEVTLGVEEMVAHAFEIHITGSDQISEYRLYIGTAVMAEGRSAGDVLHVYEVRP